MTYKSDIEIAQATPMQLITEVAKTAGIDEKYLELYGRYKAKIDYVNLLRDSKRPDGKLILVTAIMSQTLIPLESSMHIGNSRSEAISFVAA